MLDSVRFFIHPGALVFLDDIVRVVVDRSPRHQPGLIGIPHNQPVEIESRSRVLNQDFVGDELIEIFLSFPVDNLVVEGGILRQIDFRLHHVEKAIWFSFDPRPRLGGI